MIKKKATNRQDGQRLGTVMLPILLVALAIFFGSQVLPAQARVTRPDAITCGGTAYATIQDAVNDPNCTDIVLSAGYYTGTAIITRSITITGAGPALTTVDGLFQNTVFTIGNGYGTSPTLVQLSNFTIRGGDGGTEGGGIYNNYSGYLTIDNMVIDDSTAGLWGGGIYNKGILTITNSSLSSNSALNGGAIYSGGSLSTTLYINDSVIANNVAFQNGGGMFLATNLNVEINNSEFVSNTANNEAGGIYAGNPLSDSLITPIGIQNSLIAENIAVGTGGISVANHVTIDASEIISNTGGNTDQDAAKIYGGGVSIVYQGVLTLTNSTVSNNILIPTSNSALAFGGGIHVGGRGCRLWMDNTTVSNNEPDGVVDSADAIVFESSAVVDIRNSDISNNIGNGINGKGTINITNSTIEENTRAGVDYRHTDGFLGVLSLKHSFVRNNGSFGVSGNDIEIKHSLIRQNSGYGVLADNVYMQFSTISGHNNINAGGGLKAKNIELQSSTVANNHSDMDGGGIYATGVLTVVNSTVSGNTANGSGGGIALVGNVTARAHLDSVTVAENTADLDADDAGAGGGIYRGANAGSFNSKNSIIADNQDLSGPALAKDHDCFGDFTSGTTNIIGYYPTVGDHCTGFSTAWDQRNVDPLLAPLADNGGPTWTHAIDSSSPADEPFSNVICQNVDQRGVDRVDTCDIGAYEFDTCAAPVPLILTITGDGNHILLDWDHHAENREVEIWRGTDPHAIVSFSNIWTNLTAFTAYTDHDAIGNPLTNYFYAIRSQNACGAYSTFSNRVGEFDFQLNGEHAAQSFAAAGLPRFLHFALIALPLEGADLPTTADGVAEYIDPEGGVRGVAKWNPHTQSWVVRRVGNPYGTPDFIVSPGDVLFLAMTKAAPETFAWVGAVPAVGSIQNTLTAGGVNAIIVPLDQSGKFTMTADGLAADIGDVTHVGFRSTAQQRWYVRLVGQSGLNFPVRPGYPYAINLPEIIIIPPLWPIVDVK